MLCDGVEKYDNTSTRSHVNGLWKMKFYPLRLIIWISLTKLPYKKQIDFLRIKFVLFRLFNVNTMW